jgi:hypothetical protein
VEDRVVSVRTDESQSVGGQSVGGCVVWLGWMAVGNLVLLPLSIFIMREGRWTLSGKDLAFWLVVPAVLALRYIDLTRFGGRQVDGSPAPPGLFKVYALRFVGAWLVVWALAHSVQWLS